MNTVVLSCFVPSFRISGVSGPIIIPLLWILSNKLIICLNSIKVEFIVTFLTVLEGEIEFREFIFFKYCCIVSPSCSMHSECWVLLFQLHFSFVLGMPSIPCNYNSILSHISTKSKVRLIMKNVLFMIKIIYYLIYLDYHKRFRLDMNFLTTSCKVKLYYTRKICFSYMRANMLDFNVHTQHELSLIITAFKIKYLVIALKTDIFNQNGNYTPGSFES